MRGRLVGLTIAALSTVPSSTHAEAFGIHKGKKIEELGLSGSGSNYIYTLKEVPSPYPVFERYYVEATPRTGICRVIAATEDLKKDDNLNKKFSDVRGQIVENYGDDKFMGPTNVFIRSSNMEPPYTSYWEKQDNLNIKDDIKRIELTVKKVSDATYIENNYLIVLNYFFDNWKECQAEE